MEDDGCFHFTGEGESGDQEMVLGNAAVLYHKTEDRSLRLFFSRQQLVTYQGEVAVDDDRPYYTTEAPDASDGLPRTVIVFRLRPLEPITQGEILRAVPTSDELLTKTVGIERRHTEEFLINPRQEPIQAQRREAELVHAFCNYVTDNFAVVPMRNEIQPPGEAKPLFSDVYIEEFNVLIEVKGTTTRAAFRMAIGQLADYRRFLNNPRCAILLPSQPRQDLLYLAEAEGIALLWPSAFGFESTTPLWPASETEIV